MIVLIQFIPIKRTNPVEAGPLPVPQAVETVLERACYDCHSNKTKWPWYSGVAPLSWWIVDHVNEGREHLNFSEWERMNPEDQKEAMEEIIEEVEEQEMPLSSYVLGHPEAALTNRDIEVLREWVQSR